MKVITINKIKRKIDKNIDYGVPNYNYQAPTTKQTKATWSVHVFKLNEHQELIIAIATITGNVRLEIKTTNGTLDYAQSEKMSMILNVISSEVPPINVATPQFEVKNNRILAVKQPNSIWLPEIALKNTLTAFGVLNKKRSNHASAAKIIFALAYSHHVTTVEQLMALLNECTIQVDCVSDILKLPTPTTPADSDSTRLTIGVQNAIDSHIQLNDYQVNESTNRNANIYREHAYFNYMYYAAVNPMSIDYISLIQIYQSVKKSKDMIENNWTKIINTYMQDYKINSFNIDDKVYDNPSSEAIIEFKKALLQTTNGDIFDVLLANIDDYLKYELTTSENPISLNTISNNAEVINYIATRQLPIKIKLQF